MNAIIRKKSWKVFTACQIEIPKQEIDRLEKVPQHLRHLIKAFTKLENIKQPKHGS